jgi:hypothetical protein
MSRQVAAALEGSNCRPWYLACLSGFSLVALIVYSFWGTVGKPDCQDLDFGSYYRAALAVRQGQTPYTVDHHGFLGVYSYAPAFAYLFIPLGRLEYIWACRLWMLLNWGFTALGLLLSLKLACQPNSAWYPRMFVAVLAVIPTTAYLWANLRAGQTAMLMLVACLGWACCFRAGRQYLGGILLATASALKLAPLALVPYLVLRRDWRGLAGFLTGSIMLAFVPFPWVGFRALVPLHFEWLRHCIATQVPLQTYRPGNQSLLAQLARLPPVSDGHHLLSSDALDNLLRLYPALVVGLAACLYIWIWSQCRKCPGQGDTTEQNPVRVSVHLALLLIFLTLAHPRAWRCNFVAFLLPCTLLARQVWQRRTGTWVAAAALAAVFLAGVWPTRGIGEHGWNCAAWLLLGKHFWGGVALAGACWWIGKTTPNALCAESQTGTTGGLAECGFRLPPALKESTTHIPS